MAAEFEYRHGFNIGMRQIAGVWFKAVKLFWR